MCVTFLIILRLSAGHQQDDLRAPLGETAEQQVPLQGDPSQHQGVSQADAETQGLLDLHKIGHSIDIELCGISSMERAALQKWALREGGSQTRADYCNTALSACKF